jgi:uncharacterized circularly permuted ATP-grasp superfamily protein/uncharacterized alpha-E superfamily protein
MAVERPSQTQLLYPPPQSHWDEMQNRQGEIRAPWQPLLQALESLGPREFSKRWQTAQQMIGANSITYNVYGDARGQERAWAFDPIPLVLPEEEWQQVERAVEQRARLLNAILDDCYGPQQLLKERRLPPELILANPNFLRPCHGFPVANNIRLHFYGVDLARSAQGQWWVIADRTQIASGAGYALENRLVGARALPTLFGQYTIRSLSEFFAASLNGLLALAPRKKRIVLLSPGPYNETYFEHSYLARTFGIPLVEGADLTVRSHKVFLKTLEGLDQVDLILRRLDDGYCDPLELRGDSLLGVPGLLGAAREGNVVIANSLGSGLIETQAHKAFLPGLCKHLLGEELSMPSVATWWCGQPSELKFVLENLPRLIVKTAFPRFGQKPMFGAAMSEADLEQLKVKILAHPEQYIAQETVALSSAPVWNDGGMTSRHIMLRAYAAWDGERFQVMPGGLTRVSDSPDSLIVSMQHGGGSKDTWVLGSTGETAERDASDYAVAIPSLTTDLPSRMADNLYWLGRYTERVESIIRILRSVVPALSAESDVIQDVPLETALQLLCGYEFLSKAVQRNSLAEQLRQMEGMIKGMIQDPAGQSPLGVALRQVRRTAWPLKARLSGDTWRVLQQLESDFAQVPRDSLRARPAAMTLQLDQSITLLAAFAGLLADSTTRGHGWRFLEIGRRLERGLQILNLLGIGLAEDEADASRLDLVLQVADSSITYRNRYLTNKRTAFVLDLLLADETNPRSVAFQLAALVDLTEYLPKNVDQPGDRREWRLALHTQSALRLADLKQLEDPQRLKILIEGLENQLFELSDALTARYLTHVAASRFITS